MVDFDPEDGGEELDKSGYENGTELTEMTLEGKSTATGRFLMTVTIAVGVLALQGAFYEHIKLLTQAFSRLEKEATWDVVEVRTAQELEKVDRKPTWGTCAGLILLAESANRTKKGGQDLIGGLDVRVNRNYFGRQTESFEADLDLPFLQDTPSAETAPFRGIFIRAPVVERILPSVAGEQVDEADREETVIAPGKDDMATAWPVEIMATLPGRSRRLIDKVGALGLKDEVGDIIAVRQRNVFGTSFHPELTSNASIHIWWLRQVLDVVQSTQCSSNLKPEEG
ncbi:MAG: hypothetical protein Q9216_003317 [Gyalolechia sp. 2 TL-2023]